jgi:hypothetical protein
MQTQRNELNFKGQTIYVGLAGQTHLNFLGFSIKNRYSIQLLTFFS